MTIANCNKLGSHLGIAATDATTLLAATLQRERIWVMTHPELRVTLRHLWRYAWQCIALRRRMPLSYLLREQHFYGLDFTVTPAVLIPRPETEFLVEQGLNFIASAPPATPVVDIGTGSGNIIISIAKNAKNAGPLYGIDYSNKALAVAKHNASRHGVEAIHWLKGNLLEPLKGTTANDAPGLLLLANLPYLPKYDFRSAPKSVRRFEPRHALVAGHDGLYYYRQLVTMLSTRAQRAPQSLWGCWEADACNTGALGRLVKKTFPSATVSIVRDHHGYKRYVVFTVL